MLKSLFRDGGWYLFAYLLSRGISLFMLPLYTRWLSPAQFGLVDLLNSILSVVVILASCEIGQGFGRFYAELDDKIQKCTFATSALVFSTLASSSVGLLIYFLSYSKITALAVYSPSNELGGLLDIFAALLIVTSVSAICQHQLRFGGSAKQTALASMVMAIVSVVGTVVLVGWLDLGPRGVLTAQLLGMLALGALSYYFGREWFVTSSFSWSSCKRMLSFSGPLIPSSLGVMAWTSMDRVVISEYLSLHELGLYGTAARFGTLMALLMIPFQSALSPLIIKHYKDKSTAFELDRLLLSVIWAGGLLTVIVTLLAHEIYWAFVGPKFWEGSWLLGFVFFPGLVSKLYMFQPGLDISKKTWVIAFINILAGIVSLVLNVVLLPIVGLAGAIIALTSASMVMYLGYGFLGARHYFVRLHLKSLALMFILLLTASTMMHYLQSSAFDGLWWRSALIILLLGAGWQQYKRTWKH